MAGYVTAVPAIVCGGLPARELRRAVSVIFEIDLLRFHCILFLLLTQTMCLIRITIDYLCPKWHLFWCFGFSWVSHWRSDKFLLTAQCTCICRPIYRQCQETVCVVQSGASIHFSDWEGGKSKENFNIFGALCRNIQFFTRSAPQNWKLCMFSSAFMLNLMVL